MYEFKENVLQVDFNEEKNNSPILLEHKFKAIIKDLK